MPQLVAKLQMMTVAVQFIWLYYLALHNSSYNDNKNNNLVFESGHINFW